MENKQISEQNKCFTISRTVSDIYSNPSHSAGQNREKKEKGSRSLYGKLHCALPSVRLCLTPTHKNSKPFSSPQEAKREKKINKTNSSFCHRNNLEQKQLNFRHQSDATQAEEKKKKRKNVDASNWRLK